MAEKAMYRTLKREWQNIKGRLVCILFTLTISSSINIYTDKQKMGVILAQRENSF